MINDNVEMVETCNIEEEKETGVEPEKQKALPI